MSDINYSLVADKNGRSLTVIFEDGETVTVPGSHPHFDDVLMHLLDDAADESWVRSRVDLVRAAGTKLRALSERVRVAGNRLLFDGDEIDGAIAEHIVALVEADDEDGYGPLVNFLEKLYTNPSENSINALYTWLQTGRFTITPDGDFIAYKGVAVGPDGVSLSIHSGKAVVNGEVIQGQIPNPDGAVVEMPRSEVDADTGVHCSTGLHAGTWNYASNFGHGRVLTVKINPRDVVSVPNDCSYAKLRVARYTVVEAVDQAFTTPTVYPTTPDPEDDEDYDDDEYDEWGDGDYDPEDDEQY